MKTAALKLFLTAFGAIHCLDQAMADSHAPENAHAATHISQNTPGPVIFDTSEPIFPGAEEMTTDTPNVFSWSRYQIGRIDGWSYRLYPDGSGTILSDADRSAENFSVGCVSADACTVIGSDGNSIFVRLKGTRRPNIPAEIDGPSLSRYLAEWILAGPDAAPPLPQVAEPAPASAPLVSSEISPGPSEPEAFEGSESASDGIAGRQLATSKQLERPSQAALPANAIDPVASPDGSRRKVTEPAAEPIRSASETRPQPEATEVSAASEAPQPTAPQPEKATGIKVNGEKTRPEKTEVAAVAKTKEAKAPEPAVMKASSAADAKAQPEKGEVAAVTKTQEAKAPEPAVMKASSAEDAKAQPEKGEVVAVAKTQEAKANKPAVTKVGNAEDAATQIDEFEVAAIPDITKTKVSGTLATATNKQQDPAPQPKSVEVVASEQSPVEAPKPAPAPVAMVTAVAQDTNTRVDVAPSSAMSEDCSAPDPLFPDTCAVPTNDPLPPQQNSPAPSPAPEKDKDQAQTKPDLAATEKLVEAKTNQNKDPSLADRLRLSCSLNYGLGLRHARPGSTKEHVGKSSTSLGCGIQFTDRLTMRVSLIGYPFSGQRQEWDPDFAYSLNFKATDWLAFSYSNYSGRFNAPGNGFVDSLKNGSFRASLKLPHLDLPFDKTAACSVGVGLPNPFDTSATLSCGVSITEKLRVSGTAHFYAPGTQLSYSPDFSYTASYKFTDRVTLTYSNYANNRWPWNPSGGRDADFLDGSFSLSYKLDF
ncbi:hypothetical protein WNZ14_10265 [Hoeflea sp. AS60]|uniref:hypothetical protein n=1 Tax=Hoeflea sp. AS60 TaxID=3135780 RepID=UPI00317CFF2D